jgi:hypothetical protein
MSKQKGKQEDQKMKTLTVSLSRRTVSTAFLGLLAGAAMLGGAQPALAETVVDGCMQDAYQILNHQSLNCTANDIQLSNVTDLNITDPCQYPGDTVTFTATFETVLTAQARHDIGIYFSVDGDAPAPGELTGDGALTGTCSVSTVDYTPNPPWLDLDGTGDDFVGTNISSGIQDTCGDIDGNHNPLYPVITVTAVCVDNDQDGFLDLPYCTSWRQPGANELCTGPLPELDVDGNGHASSGVIPGSPSKCNCNPGFNVPVPVPPASLTVVKTANPTSLAEPGGPVTFSVSVTNGGIDPNNSVTINSLMDNIYNDITTTGHDGITSTTCVTGSQLGAGETYSCTFTATVSGDGGDSETDTVTAKGTDSRGNPVEGTDDATVTITDVLPSIAVVKTANPTTVYEPGGSVTFSVLVTNNSVSSDPVTIDDGVDGDGNAYYGLYDSIHGDLNGQGDCSVPQTLAGNGGTYSCSFTANVNGNAGYTETDTVTATGTDDEGNPVSASDSAVVTVLDVASSITMLKTANPTSLIEPGGDVTYTYLVTNTSTVDTVTIKDGVQAYGIPYLGLYDDILGDLNGQGDCSVPQVLAPNGGSYSCSVTAPVTGNAGDSITNTATAKGEDDDLNPVMASDTATVNITNEPPAASLTKTPTSVLVTYEVEVCNDSDAESLTLDDLDDDVYGDIADQNNTDIYSTGCIVPQTLEPDGDVNDLDCYKCSFIAETSTSPTIDTVTGTVNDDDGSTPATPSGSAYVEFGAGTGTP